MAEDNEQDVNNLSMSDEEFMEQLGSGKLDNEVIEEEVDSSDTDDSDIEDENIDETDGDSQDDVDDNDSETDNDVDETDVEEDDEDNDDEELDSQDADDETSGEESTKSKADHERIFAPFKANGTEMQVDNVDDAISLMQMGANFTKKMQQLKPNLKIVKMLENNGLLDQGKLNHLIDLHKQNPAAITKLIKESKIDPLDIDVKEDDDYEPTSYEVSDSSFQLDQAIDDIRGSETFDKTINIMGKQWDDKSKEIVADNPDIVAVIDSHVQNGIYDEVNKFVTKEKALGRMSGLSDVEAYREGVQKLQESGALVETVKSQPEKKENALEKEVNAKKAAATKKKKKAIAPTKKTSSKTSKKKVDYLDMPDDEFMKKFG